MAKQVFSPLVIGLIILGILGASLFVYFQIVRGMAPDEPPVPAPAPPPARTEPPTPEPEEPEIEIPPLDASDQVIRSLTGALSSHPQMVVWLAPEDLVRRFVAAVVNVANDESPRPNVSFLEPAGDFRVRESEGRLVIDPRAYARYNLITEVLGSLDSAESVRLYRELKPLFDEAYQDLGFPGGDFDRPLARAIGRVVSTRVPAESATVRLRVTNYRYADPALEGLGAIEKHLLRMGPANAREVQKKLRFLRTALSLDE